MKISVNFTYQALGKLNRMKDFQVVFSTPLVDCLICASKHFMTHDYNEGKNWNISLIADNSTKAALYEVPANVTAVDVLGSGCGDKEDTLKVSWNAGNNFAMNFATNASKYDLASFVINLNTSSLFNDSAGEFVMMRDDLSV